MDMMTIILLIAMLQPRVLLRAFDCVCHCVHHQYSISKGHDKKFNTSRTWFCVSGSIKRPPTYFRTGIMAGKLNLLDGIAAQRIMRDERKNRLTI
jgi:hypothetical protein